MAVRDDFAAGEVLAAADLNDTFASKLDLAGGKILQIVRATDATDRSTTSTSFVDITGLSVTITPQKSDSAILVWCSVSIYAARSSGRPVSPNIRLTDSSNNALSGAEFVEFRWDNQVAAGPDILQTQANALGYSTPATTSAVTYKARFVASVSTTVIALNATSTAQIYAIEVSA